MDKSKKPKFDRTQPFNDLPDLPPSGDVQDKEVLMKWGLASRALAELNKNILRIPNPSMLVNTISLQEAQSSTAIENIFTTEDELYKAVSDTIKESSNPATKEVLRYREALWDGYKTLKKKNKFDESTALKIFRQIKNTTEGIRPPQSQVIIKRGQSDLRPGEIIYTPPRGAGLLKKKMANLFDFLNTENDFDPLLKMVIAHYQFEAIHPFTDGNGRRTGRILNLLYLVDQKLLSHPVLYLSKFIINHKDDYYHLLSGVTQRQAWKPWLLYMLNAVESTAQHTNQKIDEILEQMDATHKYARKKLRWYTLELNQALFLNPTSNKKKWAKSQVPPAAPHSQIHATTG